MNALIPLALVTPICVWVAWSDLTRMKIPNRAVMALVLVFLVLGPFAYPLSECFERWLQLPVVLMIGFLLTAAGLVGAGDAKYMAAIVPFIHRGDAAAFMLLVALLILIAFAAHRAARACPAIRTRAPHWESWERRDFPMGVPLSAALMCYLVLPSGNL